MYALLPAMFAAAQPVKDYYGCLIGDCKYMGSIILALACFIVISLLVLTVYTDFRIKNVGVEVLGLLGLIDEVRISESICDIMRFKEYYFKETKAM